MNWSPVYHVTAIFGNHMTAGELWVKWGPPLASLLSNLQPNWTFYGGIMESQARSPPLSALFTVNSAG